MICNATVKKRVFSIGAITEEEGKVLRTLLNLSEKGIRSKLNADRLYWVDELGEDDAVRIGNDLCQEIMNLVDNKQ